MLGVLLALSATSVGYLACSRLGMPRTAWLAPAVGVATLAALGTWCATLGVPPRAATLLAGLAAVSGAVLWLRHSLNPPRLARRSWPRLMLLVAALLPILLLSLGFAGLEVPVSNHDGAYHVETIDALRRGLAFQTWYPHGYHVVLALLLGAVPWVDTARGTLEASWGITVLAVLAVFGLARAARFAAPTAACAGLILAVSPMVYDLHLWGGWPLATSLVLVVGLWSVAIRWLQEQRLGLALAGGLLAGALLLTHGTEVYSAAIGLLVLALAGWRRLSLMRTARHVGLAFGLAFVVAAPYITTLLGWAQAGGASGAGAARLEASPIPTAPLLSDPTALVAALVGGASTWEVAVRVVLVTLGILALVRSGQQRWLVAAWAVFGALLVAFDTPSAPLVSRIYVATFPWADGHRLAQVVTILASLLGARGAAVLVDGWHSLGRRFDVGAVTWRRMSVACAILVGFLLEGGAIGAYKYLADLSQHDATYTAEDAQAMAWLHQHAAPGAVLANNFSADAGVWAPYKAHVPILLPRSGDTDSAHGPGLLEAHLADLTADAALAAEACARGVGYVYAGAKANSYDHAPLDVSALERSPALEEVFRSGNAAVFQVRLTCSD